MPIHHAVLSLLSTGESYGYGLKAAFERSAGPQWGSLNIGHLYQVLDRLRRDGWVEVVRAEPQPRRPDRTIYAITPAGREELDRWLETPTLPAAGYRDDLYLKLVAGARAGVLPAIVKSERGALLAALHAVRALRDRDELSDLLREGAALQIEARLRLLVRAGANVDAIHDAVARERAPGDAAPAGAERGRALPD
jgi:DNA-binding PadR family transcriptional regulator